MTVEQRFSELRGLTHRTPGLASVARLVIASLKSYDDATLMRLTTDERSRDDMFARLWQTVVEPPVRTGDPTLDASQMAWEGVVIDHILSLAAAGALWRKRTEDLLPIAA